VGSVLVIVHIVINFHFIFWLCYK